NSTPLTETFTVHSFDGTAQAVTVTIHGANDAAVIGGAATGAVTEASGVLNGTPGTSPASGALSATDVDSSADFNVQTNASTSFGHFSIDEAGGGRDRLGAKKTRVPAPNKGR